MSDIIDNLLPVLAQRTMADPWFDGIEVLSENKADWLTRIRAGLGYLAGSRGKIGACIMWAEPILDESSPNVQFGPFELQLSAFVLYNPLTAFNTALGVQVTPIAIGRRLRTLKGFPAVGIASALQLDSPYWRSTTFKIEGIEDLQLLAYEARFKCVEADTESQVKVPPPAISLTDEGLVQMSCSDVAAALYWTSDGTYPRVGNTEARLYSAPVSVAAGLTVSAAAYVSGSIPSNVVTRTI